MTAGTCGRGRTRPRRGPAAVRVAPLQGALGPGQVLVGGAAALLGQHGLLGHPALAGPASPQPPSVKRSPSLPPVNTSSRATWSATAPRRAPGGPRRWPTGARRTGAAPGPRWRRPGGARPCPSTWPPGWWSRPSRRAGSTRRAQQDAAHPRILRSLPTTPTSPGPRNGSSPPASSASAGETRSSEEQVHAWGTGCAGRRPAGGARPDGRRLRRRRRRGRRRQPAGPRRQKIGLVFDSAGRGDKSFNDSAAAGLDATKRGSATRSRSRTSRRARTAPTARRSSTPGRRRLRAAIPGSASRSPPTSSRRPRRTPTCSSWPGSTSSTRSAPRRKTACLGFKEHEGSFHRRTAAALKSEQHGRLRRRPGGRADRSSRPATRRASSTSTRPRARTSRSWSTTPATPSRPSPTRPRARAGPQADRPGRRRALPRRRFDRQRGGRRGRRQPEVRHRGRLRPEPDRQPGRAEVDPDLDAQAGRHRRAGPASRSS